jgi:hypothetical protein
MLQLGSRQEFGNLDEGLKELVFYNYGTKVLNKRQSRAC